MNNIFKRATYGLAMGHFSIEIYAALLVPLYPLITSKLGVNLALFSLTIALGHLCASMLQPYFGFIADKLNHRIFLVWGLVVTSIFIPLSSKSSSIYCFALCLLLGMLGNAFFHPQSSSLMKDFNKNNPEISKMMGIFLGLGTIGYAIGPYLGTFAVERFGLDNLIYMAFLGLIYALFMYFFVPKMPEREEIQKGKFTDIVKEILKDKTCMILVFISTMKSAVSICFGVYAPFLLEKHGFSLCETGFIVTLFYLAGGAATILSSKVEKRLGARGTMALSMLSILPLTLGFLAFLKVSHVMSVIFFVLAGFFVLLSVGIILVLAQRAMPKYTGVISGTIQGAGWGLGSLFLAPMGIVGQIWGVDKILIIVSLCALLTGIYCLKTRGLDNLKL